ncbi:hypothetical protein [Cellulomonas alba]|uniref:Ig-like domain-containing protein n=1 Tax=Cellulomonas alba TaxID=3053467 RepID=A0ABT7SGJ1_9CELL|nr:hypothetical protein [Cellulomonas alba]MDM7855310.1 hypothetical protein [Cellulomonas alba]
MRLLSRGATTLVGLVAASIAMPALAAPAFADAPAPFTCSAVSDAPLATIAAPSGWALSAASQWRDGGVSVSTDGSAALTATHTGDFALGEAAALAADYAAASPTPTVALAVDFSGTGADGQSSVLTASGATDASTAWTLDPSADATLAAAAPTDTTAAGWAAAFPGAVVHSVGYAFATGGDSAEATLTSVTADCVRYTFGLADAQAPTVALDHTAKVGQTLGVTATGWNPQPTTVTTSWQVGAGAPVTAATFTPAAADAGKLVTATVTGTAAGYRDATNHVSATIATADFAGSPNPTLSGTVRVGSKVTAALGTWAPKPTAVAYQWRIDGKAVTGATASSFVPRAADRGHQLSVVVTATLPGYTKAVRASGSTVVGYGVFGAPKPTISGSSQVGSTLTLHRGTWTPAASSYSYRWLRNGSPISGATKSTYKVTSTDRGKYLSVRVTGKASGYTTKVVTSSSVKATVPFKATHAPTITGTLRVSSTLTAHVSAWSPTATFHYQWKRNGQAISGATHSTYKLAKADHGAKITVAVTGTRSGYTTKTRTSASTTTIAWPKGMTSPKITRQPQWAAAAMNGKATFSVTATGGGLHYQWQYSSDGGHTWKTYAGKTSSTLTVTATSGVSLYRYRVVVSNVISSVTSGNGALAILSGQATPFNAGDPFLLDSWSSVVFDTEDLGWYDETRDVLSAEAYVCYGDAGLANPANDLTIRLKVGGTYYDASLIAGDVEDGIDSVGNLASGQCQYFYVYAVVPISVVNGTAFSQAVWAVTDNTNGNAFTQFVKVNLVG